MLVQRTQLYRVKCKTCHLQTTRGSFPMLAIVLIPPLREVSQYYRLQLMLTLEKCRMPSVGLMRLPWRAPQAYWPQ